MTRIYRKDINHVSEQISRIHDEHTPVCVVHVETSGLDPDEDEILENDRYTIQELLEMIDNGTINDSKTLCAILRARKYLYD